MTDHYDPSSKVLRLSDSVYGQSSIAAVGVAAHETGHAIQHAVGYGPLVLRGTLVPIAQIGSGIGNSRIDFRNTITYQHWYTFICRCSFVLFGYSSGGIQRIKKSRRDIGKDKHLVPYRN